MDENKTVVGEKEAKSERKKIIGFVIGVIVCLLILGLATAIPIIQKHNQEKAVVEALKPKLGEMQGIVDNYEGEVSQIVGDVKEDK